MPIIDIHTHTFPDRIAPTAIAKLENMGSVTAVGDGTSTGLTAAIEAAGADYAVVCPVATSPRQVASINAKAEGSAYPHLILWGAMHPQAEDIGDAVDAVCQRGMAGVKLHPEYQDFSADDRSVYPLYEVLQARDRILIIHAGEDIAFHPPFRGTPRAIARVARDFPRLRIIAAHMGGNRMWDDAETYLADRENIFLDTAFCVGEIPNETFLHMVDRFGAERILMGSDWPWADPGETIRWLQSLPLPSAHLDGILGGNAACLLGL